MNEAVQSELESLKNIIADDFPVEQIYLFGSYAYGVPHKRSDLDLYVVLRDDAPWQNFDAMMKIRETIAHKKTMPVDIVVKKRQEFLAGYSGDEVCADRKIKQNKIRIYDTPIDRKVKQDGILIYDRSNMEQARPT